MDYTTLSDSESAPPLLGPAMPPLEAYIAAFIRGSGRTAESYDDSWPATTIPFISTVSPKLEEA